MLVLKMPAGNITAMCKHCEIVNYSHCEKHPILRACVWHAEKKKKKYCIHIVALG